MSDPVRLPTKLWLDAHLRHLQERGLAYYVLQSGSDQSGTILLKLNAFEKGVQVLTQIRAMDGSLGWMAAFSGEWVAEAKADEYIARAKERDPDLWILEIEDRNQSNPFANPYAEKVIL
jgi:hypothetical protein